LLVPLTWSVARSLIHRDIGVDVIALLAMAGALALSQFLAGAVIALMLAGGNALESFAQRRARRELSALIERAPKTANRLVRGAVEQIPAGAVAIGDRLVVRAGEVVPTDGTVAGAEALVDESTLTGEPLPVLREMHAEVRAGTLNAGDAFEMTASRVAADSAYSALVRLVEQAERSQAPFVRMADRYAAFLLPVTLIAAGAAWAVSGESERALAVLVIATPCPLILAAPVAFVAGVSRLARAGVIVKSAGVIEAFGRARTVLLDKTGTVTLGAPQVELITPAGGSAPGEILRVAASLDQFSVHTLATALVDTARAQGLELAMPTGVEEGVGQGISGTVEGVPVSVGSWAYVRSQVHGGLLPDGMAAAADGGRSQMFVVRDRALIGSITMADRLRADAPAMIARLRDAGVRQIALVTGDRTETGEAVGRTLGVDRVYSEQTPAGKVEIVTALRAQPRLSPVIMVGDGVNDAPALAAADAGVALGTAGATVASETADAVITVDRIDRIADAIQIGHRSVAIARQSVIAGISLSMAGMVAAGLGYLPPIAGAIGQEAIDLGVILNALRALSGGR
ncbi:MAG TPA: heavy metal translocating P-type ATPase, partial [Gaiellales bacterium]|nr:heavy metal translocating P-type ATPase [Gaiellales bacterium]